MKKHTFILLALIAASLIVNNCKKENFNYSSAPVFKAEGPKSGKVLEKLTYTLSFSLGTPCQSFEKFEENNLNFSHEIKVIAKDNGSPCIAMISQGQANYIFRPAEKGTYYLKFQQYGSNYVIDTVVVN